MTTELVEHQTLAASPSSSDGEMSICDQGVALLVQLIDSRPRRAEAWNDYGVALYRVNDISGAIDCYKQAMGLAPSWEGPYVNLGNAYLYLGQINQAVAYYRQALQLNPNLSGVHCNIGSAFKELEMDVEAEACFTNSLALDPSQCAAHFNLATLWEAHENFSGAAAHYGECLRLQPTRRLRELRRITMCPTVFPDMAAIDAYRAALLRQLQDFGDRLKTVDVHELEVDGCAPPFNLPYHGRNDRPIKEAFAAIYHGKIREPMLEVRRCRDGRSRIGFVVTHRHESAMLRCLGGVLDHLPDDVGELNVFCDERSAANLHFGLNLDRVQMIPVSRRLGPLANAIREARLDVLYHWEVGTDKTNYLLPFMRLAPVQCTSWGIPETAGVPDMKYLSSTWLEGPQSQEDYTEALSCLHTLLAFYRRRVLAGNRRTPADFGLPSDRHIYLCAQYPAKLHPDFDLILANILRHDEFGVIVLVTNAVSAITEKLRQRFLNAMPDVASRILFLPFQQDADYLHLVSLANVVLDPLYYGGVTTTYDAFAVGTPVVTLPTPFQRGRYAAALYRRLSLDIGVAFDASDYAHRAISLATSNELRRSVSDAIMDRSDAIFEDYDVVDAYANFFRDLVAEA